MKKYIAAWFPMILIAAGNGAFREFVLRKFLNELPAHQISTIILILFFTVYIRTLIIRWGFASRQQALIVGMIWCIMTLIFEFGFGHYVAGHSWERLLNEYNLASGRLWIFIPVWIIFAPFVLYRSQKS